jgi:hypothetical protein
MTNKRPTLRRTIIAVVFSVLLLVAVTLIAYLQMGRPVTAQAPEAGLANATDEGPPVSDEYVTVRTQDFGVWSYAATRSDIDPLHASVNYKHATVADLKAYVEANKALFPEVLKLGGIDEVAVSFAYPVSENYFESWLTENQFQLDSSQSVGVFHVYGTADEPLSQDELGNLTNNAGGIFGAYGAVDAAHLEKLWADPDIFLVDVTPTWVKYELVQSGINEPIRGRVQVALPFGWMDQLGMHNFTDQPIPQPQTTFEPILLSPAPDEP